MLLHFAMNHDVCQTKNVPEVGMECTICIGSDSYPGEVMEVNGKSVVIREMDVKIIARDIKTTEAIYAWESDPDGELQTFTLRKNGRYVPKGKEMGCGTVLSLGKANYYRDPNF